MTDNAQPTTEAGRRLLPWARALDARLSELLAMPDYHGTEQVVDESVAAIEAEARAESAAKVRALQEALASAHRPHRPNCPQDRYPGNHFEPPDPCECGVEALLAAPAPSEPGLDAARLVDAIEAACQWNGWDLNVGEGPLAEAIVAADARLREDK